MRRFPLAFVLAGTFCASALPQGAGPALKGSVVLVDQEPGTTADQKYAACVGALLATGGICDGRGFGATTQTIAATVSTANNVFLRMNPVTIYQPSSPSLDMFSVAENSGIEGLTVVVPDPASFGYRGTVVKFVGNCLQSDRCYLRDFKLSDGTNGTNPNAGTAVLLSAAAGVNGLAFVDLEHGRITGFLNGLYLTSTGVRGSGNFVNDTRAHDITITNAVHCITLYSNPGDIMGNTFDEVTCEAGGGDIAGATGFVVKGQSGSNGKANLFINGNIWDYGAGSVKQRSYLLDAYSAVNWLQANIPMGPNDESFDAGRDNQVWNLGFALQIRQAGIRELQLIPAQGYTKYWLTTNGSGNQVCLSSGQRPGGSPVCVDGSGDLAPSGHFNQSAQGNFAGKCSMANSAKCTFHIDAGFNSPPICIATEQTGSSPIGAGCVVSGKVVTITAARPNSAEWGALIVGNPN